MNVNFIFLEIGLELGLGLGLGIGEIYRTDVVHGSNERT